jgi:hypothetical protein
VGNLKAEIHFLKKKKKAEIVRYISKCFTCMLQLLTTHPPNGAFGRLMNIIRLHIDTVRLGKGGNKQVKNKLRTTPTGHAYGAFRLTLGLSLESSFIFLIFFVLLSTDTGSWSFSLAPPLLLLLLLLLVLQFF